jgi:hypothetical protein
MCEDGLQKSLRSFAINDVDVCRRMMWSVA